jgi:tetratricopeptide (TPR) repeat protein
MNTTKFLDIPSLHPNHKGYRVVFEKQDENPGLEKKERKIFEELYVNIQEDPQKHLDALIQFCRQHPTIPEAANLLTFAFLKLKKRKEAEELIEKAYLKHPDYLIARINYADQVLRLKKKELIPAIFNGCYDLHVLYPEKKTFHYSEFRGFMTVMGFYHLEIGEKEKAEEYYQLAFQVDPLHPAVAALEKQLSKTSCLRKIFQTLQKLACISRNS